MKVQPQTNTHTNTYTLTEHTNQFTNQLCNEIKICEPLHPGIQGGRGWDCLLQNRSYCVARNEGDKKKDVA